MDRSISSYIEPICDFTGNGEEEGGGGGVGDLSSNHCPERERERERERQTDRQTDRQRQRD